MSYTYELPEDYRLTYGTANPGRLDEDPGSVLWFGRPWPGVDNPAPVCHPDTHAPTPVGYWCVGCGENISQSDRGVIIPSIRHDPDQRLQGQPWGLECFLHSIGVSPR